MVGESSETVYFDEPGAQNTDETLRLARILAEKLGIRNISVASSSGATGVKASRVFDGYNLVVVTHVVGLREPNVNEFLPKNREVITNNGGNVVTATHAFGTLGRAVHKKLGAVQIDEIIANVLRIFGQGMKVACEVSCMAADAGLVNVGEESIVIGGSSRGADTAVVLIPSNTHTFFNTKVKEIICKPRL